AFDDEEPTNEKQIILNDSVNTTDLLNEVKAKIYTILCYYYPNPVPHGLVSALLDPRLKSLDFVKVTNKLAAKRILRNLYDNEKLLENEENLSEYENQDSNNANKIDDYNPNDDLLYTPCLLKSLEKDDSQVTNEIEEYFRIPEISLRKDPLSMDFDIYVDGYIRSEPKDWSVLSCLKHLKDNLVFTSDSKQDILNAIVRTTKNISYTINEAGDFQILNLVSHHKKRCLELGEYSMVDKTIATSHQTKLDFEGSRSPINEIKSCRIEEPNEIGCFVNNLFSETEKRHVNNSDSSFEPENEDVSWRRITESTSNPTTRKINTDETTNDF
ncbi:2601_t:CDS:2, partial [Cetraspora pellucida]